MPATAPAGTSVLRSARAALRRAAPGSRGSIEGSRRGPWRGPGSAGLRPAGERALDETLRPRSGAGPLVDVEDLGGHVGPGEPFGALGGGGRHRRAPGRVAGQLAQRLAQLDWMARRHQQAVDSRPNDVAVAGDVRGHGRRARGEGLRQHHAEALPAQRGGAQEVGLAEQAPLLLLRHPPRDVHALRVEEQRLDLVPGGAGDSQPGRHAGGAERLEGAQQHGQPLALLGAAHEEQAQLLVPTVRRSREREIDAVRNDPVAAPVEALGGPAGGLGHRDAGGELRVQAARPGDVRGEATH
jgi:hypothetical protein